MRSSSSEDFTVRLVELQWDMQTGNFMEGSLDFISSATVSGRPRCLSALVASGSRCLQVSPPTLMVLVVTFSLSLLSDSLQVRPFVVSVAHLQRICNFVHIIVSASAARH
jgi:hypothetical protein